MNIYLLIFYLVLITLFDKNENVLLNNLVQYSQSEFENNFVYVKGGSFIMGDNETSKQLLIYKIPEHSVNVSDFFICNHETTIGEFKQFVDESSYMTDFEKCDEYYSWIWNGIKWIKFHTDWKHDATGKLINHEKMRYPVVHITWNDAIAYCKWLTKKYGKQFRLPTEAEWEFSASSRGFQKPYSWGTSLNNKIISGNISDSITKAFWKDQYWFYLDYYNDGFLFTAPVCSFKPNEIGLYDMTGNVYEFCSDYYDEEYYLNSTLSNPTGPKQGDKRVIRGGSYFCLPAHLKIFNRCSIDQNENRHDVGFRVCKSTK